LSTAILFVPAVIDVPVGLASGVDTASAPWLIVKVREAVIGGPVTDPAEAVTVCSWVMTAEA
jgi:hypothetical protein